MAVPSSKEKKESPIVHASPLFRTHSMPPAGNTSTVEKTTAAATGLSTTPQLFRRPIGPLSPRTTYAPKIKRSPPVYFITDAKPYQGAKESPREQGEIQLSPPKIRITGKPCSTPPSELDLTSEETDPTYEETDPEFLELPEAKTKEEINEF